MHACDLVQVAAMIGAQGRVLIEEAPRISASALESYWVASRLRFDRWVRVIKAFTLTVRERPSAARAGWPNVVPVIEEVLLAEPLTRIWSAMLKEHDRRTGDDECDAIGRSVLMAHLEARHRVLALLLHGPGVGTVAGMELNRLRRKIERWIDLLVGNLLEEDRVTEFAIDTDRAREFATESRRSCPRQHSQQALNLTLASLTMAFGERRDRDTKNGDLNLQIAQSIVACFPPELFSSTGVLRSLWSVRLTHATQDAQGMIDELVRLEREPVGVSAKRF